jgi:hypothetical protein
VRVIASDAGSWCKKTGADIALSKLSISFGKGGPSMPEQGTVRRAQRDLKEGKSYTEASSSFDPKDCVNSDSAIERAAADLQVKATESLDFLPPILVTPY